MLYGGEGVVDQLQGVADAVDLDQLQGAADVVEVAPFLLSSLLLSSLELSDTQVYEP